MPKQQYIKHAYEKEDRSINEIARSTCVSWRTAKKYAHKEDWNPPKRTPRPRPVMDPWADTIDTWLQEDRLLPRKQRRTAAQIFRDLKERGFTGGERTVREFVSLRKRRLLGEGETPFIKLTHRPGEAQADFGTASVVRDGRLEEITVLTLSFPFSNAAVSVPLPSENAECFLEGLKRLFERTGGVPQKVRLDNLSAAVAHVGHGESRTMTDAFRRFMLHHRFEAEFCGPARGNEKGHVENKVGYTRRQWLTPPPAFTSFDALAEDLWAKALKDMDRPHYEKGTCIAELWKEEQASLLSLPKAPFEVARVDRAVLNKYAQMRWGGKVYEVPQGRPQMPVLLKVYWDRIEVRDDTQQLLTTLERRYDPKRAEIDWAAHFANYARRPRAVTQAALFEHLPTEVQRFLRAASPEDRAGRVRLVRDLLQAHSITRIAEALRSIGPKSTNRAALLQMLYALDPAHGTPPPLQQPYTPPDVAAYVPQMSRYDQLQPHGGVLVSAAALKEQCKALKLGAIAGAYEEIPFESKEQFLTALFAAELAARKENRVRKSLKRAGFPQVKTLDAFEWERLKLPAKTTREHLTGLGFLKQAESLIFMGAVGTGKTHLAISLGVQACMAGHDVRFFRTAELANQLLEKHEAGTLNRFVRGLARCDLLILDELGFVPLHRHGAELLFNVLADCYERRSVIVTTNLAFGQWNTVLADNRLTAALVDRLVHHAHVIGFTGESYRLRHALSEMETQALTPEGVVPD